MENNIKEWEKRNRILLSEIEVFCKRYQIKNKTEFIENEFKAHTKMMTISSKIFKNGINSQVKELLEIRQNPLTS